jgi:hypothetical protein
VVDVLVHLSNPLRPEMIVCMIVSRMAVVVVGHCDGAEIVHALVSWAAAAVAHD